MAEKSVFEQIKKQNGEAFAKAVRAYDNGIFDIPDIVDIVKYAGRDAEPIMQYLISLKNIQIEENENTEDPFELLSDSGYDAYYVHNLEEQNQISKYFKDDEMLCTFRDPTRFQRYHIINAVKKNVDEIKRTDFIGKEQREDAYGTSVISIQIATEGGFISIKNRYNHTVINPDNTFNSNPDNIKKGLSSSLKKYLQVDFSSNEVPLPNNFAQINGQIVLYHREADNIYFGDSFYAKDGNIFPLNKDTELMLDTCIFNIRDRTLYDPTVCREPIAIDDIQEESGSFLSVLAHELKGKKLQIAKNKDGGYNICANGEIIVTAKNGEVTSLNLPNTTMMGNSFLRNNKTLQSLNVPNLSTVGDCFLHYNETLQILNAPKLKTVGYGFLRYNKTLQTLNVPKLKKVGDSFLCQSDTLQRLNAPKLTTVGDDFLCHNETLQSLNAPNLTRIGHNFLYYNNSLQSIELPKLTMVGNGFLYDNRTIQSLDLPNLTTVGYGFLRYNKTLQTLNAPKLKKVGNCFLEYNEKIQSLNAPKLTTVGYGFLCHNETLQSLDLPSLTTVGDDFLKSNEVLKKLIVSELEKRRLEEVSADKTSGLKVFLQNISRSINPSKDEKSDKPKKNILTRLFNRGKDAY